MAGKGARPSYFGQRQAELAKLPWEQLLWPPAKEHRASMQREEKLVMLQVGFFSWAGNAGTKAWAA